MVSFTVVVFTVVFLLSCVSIRRNVPSSASNRAMRVHFSYGVGYSQMSSLKQAMRELDQAGLGVDYTEYRYIMKDLFHGNWEYVTRNNPYGGSGHAFHFRDLRLDFSITRRWALGVLFTPLGRYDVSGGKEIPVGDGMEGIEMRVDYKGQASFLTISYFPVPAGFSRRATFRLQAGVGLNRMAYTYYNDDGGIDATASRSPLCALIKAEFCYFLNRNWSVNFDVDYKHAPVRFPETFLEEDGYSFPKQLSFHWREAFPAISADMGGFGCGVSLGFHF